MKSTILLLCYIATRLTPTVLDLVVQTTNAVVVNGMQTVLCVWLLIVHPVFYVFVST